MSLCRLNRIPDISFRDICAKLDAHRFNGFFLLCISCHNAVHFCFLPAKSLHIDDIDFDFIRKLSAECPAKIIAEGHIHYPEQAVKALEAGAFALVVGGAITRPAEITARFTGAINAAKK